MIVLAAVVDVKRHGYVRMDQDVVVKLSAVSNQPSA